MTRRVLVVDDDEEIRRLVSALLEDVGMTAIEASDGREALRKFHETQPDLVVLGDISMPEMDGIEVLRRIRVMSEVPVLLLTGSAAERAKIGGLKAGADDYVTKPFGAGELVARVEALLRRAGASRSRAPEVLSDSLVTIDFSDATVTVAAVEITLTPREFSLLAAFVRHPDQVMRHDHLAELVWGSAGTGSRDQIKVYVGHLRKKLRAAAGREPIETVRGFGYRYRPTG
jgi:DNA-binding response OmpR family regulator